HLFLQDWCPVVEVGDVFRLESVLILRAAETAADTQVLHRLHEQLRAGNLGSLAAQASDYLVGAHFSFIQWLQLSEHARSACPVPAAGESGHTVDGRIGHDDVVKLLQLFGHGGEGDVLIALDITVDAAGVLLREKTLGNRNIKIAGDDNGDDRDQENGELVP